MNIKQRLILINPTVGKKNLILTEKEKKNPRNIRELKRKKTPQIEQGRKELLLLLLRKDNKQKLSNQKENILVVFAFNVSYFYFWPKSYFGSKCLP